MAGSHTHRQSLEPSFESSRPKVAPMPIFGLGSGASADDTLAAGRPLPNAGAAAQTSEIASTKRTGRGEGPHEVGQAEAEVFRIYRRDTLDGRPRQRYHLGVMLKAVLIGLILLAAAPARADGAFPDEMQIFLPPDQPHRIIVTTTFGILESTDDGQSWRWVCEQAVTPQLTAKLYQVGPPPDHVIYAATREAISISRDDACSFTLAGGTLANIIAF